MTGNLHSRVKVQVATSPRTSAPSSASSPITPEVVELLGLPRRTVADWIGPIVATHREVRRTQVRLLSDAGWTQAAIGKAVGLDQRRVSDALPDMADSPFPVSPDLVSAAVDRLDGDAHDAAAEVADEWQYQQELRDGDHRAAERLRLAACDLAGVDATCVIHDGDAASVVLAAEDRRHLTPGARAAWRAKVMAAAGYRVNGRWKRDSVAIHGSVNTATVRNDISRAGVVLDYRPDLLDEVIAGTVALDDAHRQAKAERGSQRRPLRWGDHVGQGVEVLPQLGPLGAVAVLTVRTGVGDDHVADGGGGAGDAGGVDTGRVGAGHGGDGTEQA